MENKFVYEYTPRGNVKLASALIALCLTLSVSGCFVLLLDNVLSPYMGAAGGLFLLISLMLCVRFLGTRYLYRVSYDRLGNGELTVFELRGFFGAYDTVKSSTAVCRISIDGISECVEIKPKQRKYKKQVRRSNAEVYNYCPSAFQREYAYLKFTDDEKEVYIKFAPDEKMLNLLSR